MKIHEYQAKAILTEFGVPIPRSYALFILRELTSVFVGLFAVGLLWHLRVLMEGPEAYAYFLAQLRRPIFVALNSVVLLFILFHTISWFNLAPKAMVVRPSTPLFRTLFGAGGTIAALLFPVHLMLSGLAFPLGALEAPSYDFLYGLVGHPVTRLYLLVIITLPLFHWAHRFLYTLYNVLQLKHLYRFIAVLCYSAVLLGSAVAAYTVWRIP
ncbi:MAG: fumarate reductase subunit D [candidate division NC10 bacterium CSP1-5]|nr:MAG: fumarate reductase subunit D [candidate division NC10 bacterium CSP1-5]